MSPIRFRAELTIVIVGFDFSDTIAVDYLLIIFCVFKKIFLGLLAVGLVVSVSAPALAAPSFITNDSGTINVANPIGDDTYIAGGSVIIDSDVHGDLFIGGGTVEINANVAGDLFVGGGTVVIQGSVGDDIRIGGGQVTIHGNVGDDLMIGGGTVTIADTSTIRGDLLVGAGNFSLYGNVLGNVQASFGKGRIKGIISGNADLRYGDGKLAFADGAKINGKLDYWALNENTAFADIAKEVEYHKWTTGNASSLWPVTAAIAIPIAMWSGALWAFVGILILGGLLILLLPKYLPRVVGTTKKDYWTSLWRGALFVIVVPLLAMLFAFTGFGIPVSAVMMLSFIIFMFLASVPISMALGSYIIKYKEKDKSRQLGALVIGALIYIILGLIPFIGWMIKLILFIIGVGAMWIDVQTMVKKRIY